MTAAAQTTLGITWQSRDVSRDLAPHLLDASYTENLSGSADDLTLEFEDVAGNWSGDWRPVFGDTARVSVSTVDSWFAGTTSLDLGTFAHDKISISGPPKRATISCVSAPLATGLRRRKRTRAWNGHTLKGAAQDIANRAGIGLFFDADDTAPYRRLEQRDKSDLEFLEEAAKQVGLAVKVVPEKLIVFDELRRDSSDPVGTIDLQGGKVISWSLDDSNSERYGACTIKFLDPRTGRVQLGQFTDPNASADAQTLEILAEGGRNAVDCDGRAQARCKALLRNANRFATKGHLVTVGDCGLVAGVVFNLTNAYGFDGKFIVTRAAHKFVGGYTCTLDVRRCLEGY